jgi:hypothetical protein
VPPAVYKTRQIARLSPAQLPQVHWSSSAAARASLAGGVTRTASSPHGRPFGLFAWRILAVAQWEWVGRRRSTDALGDCTCDLFYATRSTIARGVFLNGGLFLTHREVLGTRHPGAPVAAPFECICCVFGGAPSATWYIAWFYNDKQTRFNVVATFEN